MKVAVLGDSHGHIENIELAMEVIKEADYILHTGDDFADMQYIAKKYNVKIFGVRGNYDTEPEGKDELIETIGGKKFFVTHGHRYGVKYGLGNIFYKGKELEADIVVFGHSHIPHYSVEEEMILLNPGSISIPRGGSSKTLAMLDIDQEVTIKIIEI